MHNSETVTIQICITKTSFIFSCGHPHIYFFPTLLPLMIHIPQFQIFYFFRWEDFVWVANKDIIKIWCNIRGATRGGRRWEASPALNLVEQFSPEFWLQIIKSIGSTNKRERFGNTFLRHLEKAKCEKCLTGLVTNKSSLFNCQDKAQKKL